MMSWSRAGAGVGHLLEGRRAVVTGAGSGIGRATALRFGAEGARVAVVDVDEAAAKAVADEIPDAVAYGADVRSEAAVAAAVEDAARRLGGLDTVVVNAGVQLFGEDAAAHELEAEVWERTLSVNLTGAFFTAKHGIRAILKSGDGGAVALTASPTGILGVGAGFTAYSASKAGVWGLTRVLARDYADRGIRVNAVFPGFISTPLVDVVLRDDAAREDLLEGVPLGRPGTPDEVAATMAFVVSSQASYSTGAAFFCDGGMTAI